MAQPLAPDEIRHRDVIYRRGVLLGMTMAEIMILILFCLLMGFVLEIDKYEKANQEAALMIKLYEVLDAPVGNFDDAWQKLDALKRVTQAIGLDRLNEVVTPTGEKKNADNEKSASMAESIDIGLTNYELVKQQLELERDEEVTPEDVKLELETRNMQANKWRESAKSLQAALRKTSSHGQGTEFPSCFETPGGKMQYIYDIAFDENSLILTELPVPGNEERKSELPFGEVILDKPIGVKEYLSTTRFLYDWSVRNSCRFFVRVYDNTSVENKSQYKLMKRRIEQRFYTWESP